MNKKELTQLIRSAKPTVQPDAAFIDRLELQLQRPIHDQPAPTNRWHWLWYGSWGVAASAAVVVLTMVLPDWFTSTTNLTGYIQKGPFIVGSTITIQELDDTLQPTGASYQVTTNSDFGDYHLEQKIKSDYVAVTANGFYYNEVSGKLSAAPLTLHAIADVQTSTTINVNVLTTLATPRIRYLVTQQDYNVIDAKTQTEREVLDLFKMNQSTSQFEDLTITESSNDSGILLAASVLLQGKLSVAELSELLSKLSLDLEIDGMVADDSTLMTTLYSNAAALKLLTIRENLTNRYTTLGATIDIPSIAPYIDPFVDNADPFSYRVTLLDNVFGVNRTPGATIKVTVVGNDFVADEETVSLKETVDASAVTYIDDHTLIAEFPISELAAGSYTVVVRNQTTGRLGVTDGAPLDDTTIDVSTARLVLQGYQPSITAVTDTVDYLTGGVIGVTGKNFAYGTFVWINGWQVPSEAVRVASDQQIEIDLSPALIANNAALPRHTDLTITIQTPDFQTASSDGFLID